MTAAGSRETARIYAAVAAGGALGAAARLLCSEAGLALFGPGFPWGTLAVNIAGSFLIGLFAALTEDGGRIRSGPALRQFVIGGFCGGFTTFSIFSLETLHLVDTGAPGLAGAYVAATVVLSLAAVVAGHVAGRYGGRSGRQEGHRG